MNLPESTKINIIRGGSLALVILFFAPLVRWSSWHWNNQWNNPVRFSISGWEYAIGAGTITSRPLILVIVGNRIDINAHHQCNGGKMPCLSHLYGMMSPSTNAVNTAINAISDYHHVKHIEDDDSRF